MGDDIGSGSVCYDFRRGTMEESFTKHLPFSLLAKNLKN